MQTMNHNTRKWLDLESEALPKRNLSKRSAKLCSALDYVGQHVYGDSGTCSYCHQMKG